MSLLLLPIAVAATILTYTVSYRVLQKFTALEPPRLIAAVVALLSGLSLLSLGDGVVTLILIPYAALGLSMLVLLLLRWLMRSWARRDLERFLNDERPVPPRRLPGGQRRPGRRNEPAEHLRETPPT